MASNAIRLDNGYIGGAVMLMEDLERRVENFHKPKTYDEILTEAREGLKETSPQDMTPDEYKAYIEGKLQNIPRNLTRYRDEVTVVISEAGYAAMQSDSSYEAWVLDSVREALSVPDYLCGYPGTYGRYEVMEFGATREDYRGHSSAIHKHDSRQVEEETYWERRLKRLKARLKAEQELFEHERLLMKACDESAQAALKAAEQQTRSDVAPLRVIARADTQRMRIASPIKEADSGTTIRRAEEGLTDPFAPEKPIIGVPAKYLLAMLDGRF